MPSCPKLEHHLSPGCSVPSQCDASCGRGVKTRLVLCVGLENGLYREYPEKRCETSPKPEEQAVCFRRPCSTWFTTSWSQVGLGVVGKGQGRPQSPGWWSRTCAEALWQPALPRICQVRMGPQVLLSLGSARSRWDPKFCSSAEQAAG